MNRRNILQLRELRRVKSENDARESMNQAAMLGDGTCIRKVL